METAEQTVDQTQEWVKKSVAQIEKAVHDTGTYSFLESGPAAVIDDIDIGTLCIMQPDEAALCLMGVLQTEAIEQSIRESFVGFCLFMLSDEAESDDWWDGIMSVTELSAIYHDESTSEA